MSSSGLIYAVIVGAWAAYLVPMWLRRQDELNEARPTERFTTAIRLLSGRAAMERRYAKDLRQRTGERSVEGIDTDGAPDAPDAGADDRAEPMSSVDVRAFAAPPALTEARIEVPGVVERVEPPAARAEREPARVPSEREPVREPVREPAEREPGRAPGERG
ncbi:hypothetical protein L1885_10535, partial [Streptomyces fuscigenes]|nr:hypothetical protein [Streptomyces fuscigenes]